MRAKRRREPPDIPTELWVHIFSFLSIVDSATRSDAETWADITNGRVGGGALHLAQHQHDDARDLIAENVRAKVAISSVSRRFQALIRPALLELIDVRTNRHLLALCRLVKQSPGFAEDLARHTRRLDVAFDTCEALNDAEAYRTVAERTSGIQEVFRACRGLTFVSWTAIGGAHASNCLFRMLPTLCPGIEVLFWRSNDNVDVSVLSRLLELRVFYLDSERGPLMQTCALDLPNIHTLGNSVALITAALYQFRMPSIRTLLIDELKHQHPRFAFLTIHGNKITSLRNLSLLSSGLPFQNLCPNITDLVIQLEDVEELTRIVWPHLERIGIHLARPPEDLDVQTLNFLLGAIDNCRGAMNFTQLRLVRIMDILLVKRIRSEAVMGFRLVSRRLLGWQIKLLDDEGEPLLPQA